MLSLLYRLKNVYYVCRRVYVKLYLTVSAVLHSDIPSEEYIFLSPSQEPMRGAAALTRGFRSGSAAKPRKVTVEAKEEEAENANRSYSVKQNTGLSGPDSIKKLFK